MTTNSQTYKKLQPNLGNMQEEKIIGLIQENPSIMVRPILTDGQHLITGFKETVYQTFLEQITFKG